jgi:hypothetical protein
MRLFSSTPNQPFRDGGESDAPFCVLNKRPYPLAVLLESTVKMLAGKLTPKFDAALLYRCRAGSDTAEPADRAKTIKSGSWEE